MLDMWILVKVINPLSVELRSTAFYAMYFVPFLKQKFSQVGAILAGDASYQCFFQTK
ncbi:hypothetical protein NOR51B_2367 [Luminiphilus syltensis NOR5-1B]|uniref:Uncharacterized protein n=1 Tax=Luminiphilus syltensis NOR5-1B TaxID=565045 RepID=B8KV04_9GAMM|nr:hypothetical protein NOR51B_2367 [Luminiphilus syltensis NOR5-1B]